jgi:Spx/MgsR family transcriptional regulator
VNCDPWDGGGDFARKLRHYPTAGSFHFPARNPYNRAHGFSGEEFLALEAFRHFHFPGRKIMAKAKIKFLQKPSCTSCRKAKAFLEKHKVELDLRDLGKDRLSVDELDKLIGKRDHRMFLNTRNELYRAKKMKENPPSREETLKLMAAEPNLIRRPVVLRGSDLVLGYDEEALKRIAK